MKNCISVKDEHCGTYNLAYFDGNDYILYFIGQDIVIKRLSFFLSYSPSLSQRLTLSFLTFMLPHYLSNKFSYYHSFPPTLSSSFSLSLSHTSSPSLSTLTHTLLHTHSYSLTHIHLLKLFPICPSISFH